VTVIRYYSDLFKCYYETEETRLIPNMQQNYRYLNSGKAQDQLVDIICGEDNKLVFVWKKSKVMDELYSKWCKREL
jgi:hypothetical protein